MLIAFQNQKKTKFHFSHPQLTQFRFQSEVQVQEVGIRSVRFGTVFAKTEAEPK
jgi:hypothetical protein